ncbi:hypothetical protein [Pedobacter sp. MW01-1-1]|uniref:hypothetical protein n=1 Tax=Pedobacter sp. MW01-1-1 TaxID=3383027 RepID=UPI003FED5A40
MINWLLKTFEDDKGAPDHKRMTGFAFCTLIAYMVVCDKIDGFVKLYAFLGLIVAVLVLYGIVKSQDIVEFKNGNKQHLNDK